MRACGKRLTGLFLILFFLFCLPVEASSWEIVVDKENIPLSTGITYSAYRVRAGDRQQALSILTINLQDPYTLMETVLGGDNLYRGLERPSQAAQRKAAEGKRAVAAANGDFYSTRPPYLPIGLQIRGGEILISPQGFPAMGITSDRKVIFGYPLLEGRVTCGDRSYPLSHINRERGENMLILYTPAFGGSTQTNPYGTEVVLEGVDFPLRAGRIYKGKVREKISGQGNASIPRGGAVLSGHGEAQKFLEQLQVGEWVEISLGFTDPQWNQVVEAIGGRELILQEGKMALPPGSPDPLVSLRHPRTAIGLRRDGTLEVVVVDGRQPSYSQGMTLYELAHYLQSRGVVTALNLDGGGSSVLAGRLPGDFHLTVLNRPSDGKERPTANSLAFFNTAPPGRLKYLYIIPSEVRVFLGTRIDFKLKAQDEYYNPLSLDPREVSWSASGKGSFLSPGSFKSQGPGEVEIIAAKGEAQARAKVIVVEEVEGLEISPHEVHLSPGEEQVFNVKAWDKLGPLEVDPSLYQWEIRGEGIKGEGIKWEANRRALTLLQPTKNLEIKVRLGNKEARAMVNPVPKPYFKDMEGHWAEPAVERMARKGMVSGYPDGTFKPEKILTRAEVASLLQRVLNLPPGEAAPFRDSGEIPAWARGAAAACYQMGLIKGYPRNGGVAFRAEQPVTRLEMAVILGRIASKLNLQGETALNFSDQESIPPWARQEVFRAVKAGLVSGYPDGTLRPAQPLTRAEAAASLSRLMNRLAGSL